MGLLNDQPVIVHVGDTLDVHLDDSHRSILSSNHEVLSQADQLFSFLSESVRFRVLSVGTTKLTTSTRDGCSTFGPPTSASCGVLNVTVFHQGEQPRGGEFTGYEHLQELAECCISAALTRIPSTGFRRTGPHLR